VTLKNDKTGDLKQRGTRFGLKVTFCGRPRSDKASATKRGKIKKGRKGGLRSRR